MIFEMICNDYLSTAKLVLMFLCTQINIIIPDVIDSQAYSFIGRERRRMKRGL